MVKSCENGILEEFNLGFNLQNLVGTLSQVYDEQISRIMADTPLNVKLAGHIISWLFDNARSMPAHQLIDILEDEMKTWEINFEQPLDIEYVTKVCLSLVRHNAANKTISFFHFLFQEYLEQRDSNQERPNSNSDLDWPRPASVLAEACARYLLGQEVVEPVSAVSHMACNRTYYGPWRLNRSTYGPRQGLVRTVVKKKVGSTLRSRKYAVQHRNTARRASHWLKGVLGSESATCGGRFLLYSATCFSISFSELFTMSHRSESFCSCKDSL
jgi:hypothetical protein